MMALLSKITPSVVHTGVTKVVSVRAQQSNGNGRDPADEDAALSEEPDRIDWFARCSRAD